MVKLLFWIWLIILYLLNVIPLGDNVNHNLISHKSIIRLDYLIHIITLLVFSGIYLFGYLRMEPIFLKHGLVSFSAIVISAAICLEIIQIWIPYRTFNPLDLISNLFGAVLGIFVILLIIRLIPQRQNR